LTPRARAYDNHVYVVAPNAVGVDPGGCVYFGNSLIVGPTGEGLARGTAQPGRGGGTAGGGPGGAFPAVAGLDEAPGGPPATKTPPPPHDHAVGFLPGAEKPLGDRPWAGV